MGPRSGNQTHFFHRLAALAQPLLLAGAGATFAEAGGIAMNAEETDRAGQCLSGGVPRVLLVKRQGSSHAGQPFPVPSKAVWLPRKGVLVTI